MGKICEYTSSTPGIFKIWTMVFGLSAMTCFFYGITNAKYINVNGIISFEGVCRSQIKYYLEIDSENTQAKEMKCPSSFFVKIGAGLTGLCFWVSLIGLVMHLLKLINANGKFKPIDIIGHAVGGIALFIAGALTFVYFQVLPYYCKELRDGDCIKPSPEEASELFAGTIFAIAGALALINGVVYLLTASVIKDAGPLNQLNQQPQLNQPPQSTTNTYNQFQSPPSATNTNYQSQAPPPATTNYYNQ